MTDVMTSKKRRKKKVPCPFAVELIEQLQGQGEHKDGESILGETGLAGQLKMHSPKAPEAKNSRL